MANTKGRKKNTTSASRKVKAPGSKNTIDKMKYEIANEFGVNLGATSSSRDNGKVGGEITKRLVEKSMNKTTSSTNKKSTTNKRSRKKSK